MKFNENQLDVINNLCQYDNHLVSASAGSGKTTVMIAKVLDLIVNHEVSITNMLILAFNNSVARELRNKIVNALTNECLKTNNINKKAHISEQIDLIGEGSVVTIHKLCADIIREYSYNTKDINSNFQIIEEEASEHILDNCIQKQIEITEKKDIDLLKRLFSIYNYNSTFNETIKKIHSIIFTQVEPDVWIKENAFLQLNGSEEIEKDFIKLIKNTTKNLILDSADYLNDRNGQRKDNNKYFKGTQLINSFIINIQKINDLNEIRDYIKNLTFKIDLRGERFDLSDEIKEKFKNTRKYIEKIIDIYSEGSIDEKNLIKTKEIINFAINMVVEINNRFLQQKKRRNILNYNDLEQLAFKILKADEEEIAKEISEKINYIFIDEYQDINPIQEEIIQLIKQNKASLLMIGDLKQSIYRFRLAEPDIFLSKYSQYISDKKQESGKNKITLLNESYRSTETLTKYINLLMKHNMTTVFGGINYKEDAQLIFPNINLADEEEIKNPCKIFTILYNNDSSKINDPDYISNEKIEAYKIGFEINQLLKKGVKYNDICILYRSRSTRVQKIFKHLREYNIPAFIDSTELRESILCNRIIDLLSLISNYKQDIKLVEIMLSPIGNFSENDLVNIRRISLDEKYFHNLCIDIKNGPLNQNNSKITKDLVLKIKSFFDLLDTWKDLSRFIKVSELLEIINNETSFIYKIASKASSIQELNAYEELLKEIALENLEYSISQIVMKYEKTPIRIDMDIDESDTINSMTIHKSKGLEFKHVFLIDAFGRTRSDTGIKYSRKYGMLVEIFDYYGKTRAKNRQYKMAEYIEDFKEKEESLRLFYVAITRAKQTLKITGKMSAQSSSIIELKDFSDFVNNAEQLDLTNQISHIFEVCGCEEDGLEFVQNNAINLTVMREETDFNIMNINEQDAEKIKESIEFKYKYFDALNLPIKLSVTNINKHEIANHSYSKTEQRQISKNKTTDETNTLVMYGTTYHKILEYLDFARKTDFEIREQINEMIDKQIIRHKELDVISLEFIRDAMDSDFVKMSKDSILIEKELQFKMLYDSNKIVKYKDTNRKIIVQGVVDLVMMFEDESLNTIVDYKYSSLDDVSLIKNYSRQLRLYQEAMEKVYNKKFPNLIIYNIESGEEIHL